MKYKLNEQHSKELKEALYRNYLNFYNFCSDLFGYITDSIIIFI